MEKREIERKERRKEGRREKSERRETGVKKNKE